MSERYTDSKELTDFPPSTTTISTVAVQAGRSKVVLAVLRVSNLQLAILMGTKLNSSSYYPTDSQIIISMPSPRVVQQLRSIIYSPTFHQHYFIIDVYICSSSFDSVDNWPAPRRSTGAVGYYLYVIFIFKNKSPD